MKNIVYIVIAFSIMAWLYFQWHQKQSKQMPKNYFEFYKQNTHRFGLDFFIYICSSVLANAHARKPPLFYQRKFQVNVPPYKKCDRKPNYIRTKHRRRRLTDLEKRKVMYRQNYQCNHCSETLRPQAMEIDHVIPLAATMDSDFEKRDLNRFQCLCTDCHKKKTRKEAKAGA